VWESFDFAQDQIRSLPALIKATLLIDVAFSFGRELSAVSFQLTRLILRYNGP
jgi:hypothetical protein